MLEAALFNISDILSMDSYENFQYGLFAGNLTLMRDEKIFFMLKKWKERVAVFSYEKWLIFFSPPKTQSL